MLYNLWIFAENGSALYYREWVRRKHANMSREEEAKLLYGMLFSVKSFCNKLSPTDMKDGFLSYRTDKYRLNYFETAAGLKFALNTDANVSQHVVRDLLAKIYAQVYVEYAVKSPLYQPGQAIESELFTTKLDELVKSTAIFK